MIGAWALLVSAITVEVGATAVLPRAEGFRNPGWTAVVLVGYALSIWLLTVVIRQLSVSVTYAVWSGLGTAGIALVGVLALGERWDLSKTLALVLIIGGVLILNLHTAH